MTATGHAVIGTAIAAQFSNPMIGIPLALTSHILADLFPHWDSGTNQSTKSNRQFITEAVIDLTFGFLVSYATVFFLFPQTNYVYVFIMIITAQFFDWMWVPYKLFNWKFPPFSTAIFIAKITNTKLDKPWGIILQIWIVLLLVGFAKVL